MLAYPCLASPAPFSLRQVLLSNNVRVHHLPDTNGAFSEFVAAGVAGGVGIDGGEVRPPARHHFNLANVRDMFFTYGPNVVVSAMGKLESCGEAECYFPFLENFCQRTRFNLVKPPPPRFTPLSNTEAEPQSILSLVPRRRRTEQRWRQWCCCGGGGHNRGSTAPSPAVESAVVDDYDVRQSASQRARFQDYAARPWFPVDFAEAPLFEGVRAQSDWLSGGSGGGGGGGGGRPWQFFDPGLCGDCGDGSVGE
jgi:hypothetical protein